MKGLKIKTKEQEDAFVVCAIYALVIAVFFQFGETLFAIFIQILAKLFLSR